MLSPTEESKAEEEEEKEEPIMRSQLDETMKKLKNNKSSSVDAIPVELIIKGGEILTYYRILLTVNNIYICLLYTSRCV